MFALLINLILIGLVAFGATFLLMPSVRAFAHRRNWLDHPDGGRKAHTASVPRNGGIGIWFGLTAGLLVALLMSVTLGPEALQVGGLSPQFLFGVLIGSTVAAGTGLFDDLLTLRARHKLGGQILAAVPVLMCPEIVEAVAMIFGGGVVATVFAYPLILGWILFVVNAMNLIDGIDGAAAGIGVIALLFLALFGGLQGGLIVLCVALAGSLLAFLRFNFSPAKVFMGDMGSHLIGYVLAIVSLTALWANPSPSQALGLIVLLGVPALDTAMAFVRRAVRGFDPFVPDRDHLHHRLLDRLGSVPRAALALYVLGFGVGMASLLIADATTGMAFVYLGIVLLLGVALMWKLGYFDAKTYGPIPVPTKPFRTLAAVSYHPEMHLAYLRIEKDDTDDERHRPRKRRHTNTDTRNRDPVGRYYSKAAIPIR